MQNKAPNATNGPCPGHSAFYFAETDTVITSEFDSGNMQYAEYHPVDQYYIWTAPDCYGTNAENSCRSWFYFRVNTAPGSNLFFSVRNLNLQGKLFREGMRPVVKEEGKAWERVGGEITWDVDGNVASKFQLNFRHCFASGTAEFAFTYPWSYDDGQQFIREMQRMAGSQVYVNVENMVNTLERKRCDLITISSVEGMLDEREAYIRGLFPNRSQETRPFKFVGQKKIAVISARVHPGETAASFMMNGFVRFILSNDPRARILLDTYVFYLVPMLNPDGVFKGHYRTDTNGVNLNRMYVNPTLQDHPTIFALKNLLVTLYTLYPERLFTFIDLHAHASKRGCFVFGNYLDSFPHQIETCLFAKLMQKNCVNFDFEGSCFDEKQMRAQDKRDGTSREGAGRVAIYQSLNLIRCYTLECNYHTGRLINRLPPSSLEDELLENVDSPVYKSGPPPYSIEIFENVGKAMGISLLDWVSVNQYSRIQDIVQLKIETAKSVVQQTPYRFDAALRGLVKNEQELQNMLSKKPTLLRSLSKTGRQLQRPPKPVNLKEQQRTNRSKSRSNTSRSGSRNRRLRLEKAKPEGASSANVIINRLPPIEDPGSGRGRAFAIRPHHRIHSKSPTRRFEKRGQEALRSISLDKAKIVEHLYIVQKGIFQKRWQKGNVSQD